MNKLKAFFAPLGRGLIKLGKALMLPIAVLPIAGLLLRLGQADLLNIAFMAAAGQAVFSNLPVIFALGVSIGFAEENHGAAALAAYVGYVILVSALKVLDPSIDMGVLGGIIVGVTAGLLYNKYKTIALPSYLAFFGGRRFVPIVTGAACLLLAAAAYFLWPPIARVIGAFGDWTLTSGNIGLFFYGVANRLLIPLGLHHILNNLVWFQFGDFEVMKEGVSTVLHGDLTRFFAGDPMAGPFMAGVLPHYDVWLACGGVGHDCHRQNRPQKSHRRFAAVYGADLFFNRDYRADRIFIYVLGLPAVCAACIANRGVYGGHERPGGQAGLYFLGRAV